MSGYKHCSYWLVFNNYQLSQANLPCVTEYSNPRKETSPNIHGYDRENFLEKLIHRVYKVVVGSHHAYVDMLHVHCAYS